MVLALVLRLFRSGEASVPMEQQKQTSRPHNRNKRPKRTTKQTTKTMRQQSMRNQQHDHTIDNLLQKNATKHIQTPHLTEKHSDHGNAGKARQCITQEHLFAQHPVNIIAIVVSSTNR
jgi:hypothetical protein